MGLVDTSYQPWDGARQGRLARIGAIVRAGIPLAFQGTRTKIMIGTSYCMVVFFLGLLYIISMLKMPWPMALGNNLYREYLNSNPYGLMLMLLTATVGARLISRDLEYGAVSIYLSKGITRYDYLLAKLAIMGLFLLSATLLPSFLLWLGQIGLGQEEIPWSERLSDLRAIAVHSLVIVTPASATILALSSLSRSAFVPGIAWVLIYLGSEISSAILVRSVGAWWCGLVSWQNLTAHLGNLAYEVRKLPPGRPRQPGIFKSDPGLTCGWEEPAAILGAITLLALAVVVWRLRRLERRE